MSKHSRSGGKFNGNHTTLIPIATIICDIAYACRTVTKISPGYIKAGLHSVSGQRRVKITEKDGAILLSIRDNASHQEVFIYTTDMQKTKLEIARGARNKNINVAFNKGD